MYSQCERCRTIFMLAPADLAAARGDVVCGHCGTLFNALLTLSEYPPEPDQAVLAEHAGDLPAPPLHLPVGEPARDGVSLFDPDAVEVAPVEPPPQFIVRPAAPRVRERRWWAAAALLLVVLLLQLGWVERDRWAADARLRPVLERACTVFGCALPLRHDLSRLALTSREIRPHPSVAGALLISATIRNEADFAQAFPAVRVSLSDLQEHPVATRRFVAHDYLADAGEAQRGLAPQASAVIVFEVADPGREAVAFEFSFE